YRTGPAPVRSPCCLSLCIAYALVSWEEWWSFFPWKHHRWFSCGQLCGGDSIYGYTAPQPSLASLSLSLSLCLPLSLSLSFHLSLVASGFCFLNQRLHH